MSSTTKTTEMPLRDIRVGTRYRKDLGDIHVLAESIRAVGLLHPVVLDSENRLIAGRRRLEAVRLLGWSAVPVHTVPLDDIVRGEFHENAVRKDFLPTEGVAIAAAVGPLEAKAAKARQGRPGALRSGKLPEHTKGQTREKVAAYLGVSGKTLEKAQAVVEAAKDNPNTYGQFAKYMDKTRNVSGAYRALVRQKSREAVAAAPVVGQHVSGQRYRTIVVDPPWDPSDEGDVDQIGRAQPTYATLPLAEIESLPIEDSAEKDAHIYLWITNRSLPKGFALLRAWGFRYVTMLTWCKPSIGVGNYFRTNTEHVLFGVRGSLPLAAQNIGTWFSAPRGPVHSSKPDAFYALVRAASPGPRAEWFGRKEHDGFVQRLPAIEAVSA